MEWDWKLDRKENKYIKLNFRHLFCKLREYKQYPVCLSLSLLFSPFHSNEFFGGIFANARTQNRFKFRLRACPRKKFNLLPARFSDGGLFLKSWNLTGELIEMICATSATIKCFLLISAMICFPFSMAVMHTSSMLVLCRKKLLQLLFRRFSRPARDCANVKFVILGTYRPTHLPVEAITNWFFHSVAEEKKRKNREKKTLEIQMQNISNGAEIQTHLKEANYGFYLMVESSSWNFVLRPGFVPKPKSKTECL